jgi:phage terminase small subunit
VPELPNKRHETFVKGIINGLSGTEAYKQAGYDVTNDNVAGAAASRLLADVRVSTRIAEILGQREQIADKATQKAAEALSIDREWVMRGLMEDRALARSLEIPSASIRALELLGKELGMFIERRENGNPGDFDRLTTDELRTALAAELAQVDQNRSRLEPAIHEGIARGSGRLN